MSYWKERAVERRDFRHIHHEEEERYRKVKRKKEREPKKPRHAHEFIRTVEWFGTRIQCKLCGKRKYDSTGWQATVERRKMARKSRSRRRRGLPYDESIEGVRYWMRSYRDLHPQTWEDYDDDYGWRPGGRHHGSKYSANREHMVQERGF